MLFRVELLLFYTDQREHVHGWVWSSCQWTAVSGVTLFVARTVAQGVYQEKGQFSVG